MEMLYVVVIATQLLAATCQENTPEGKKIPALFTYGDSILDTGNNNVLPTIAKCNFPPYGEDFHDHQPTGRFTNGKTPSDLIASTLAIKELLPPFLTTTRHEELLTGVCFASGGTGYDPLTAKSLNVLTMSDQLDLLREYKRKLRSIAGSERADWIVSHGVHIITGGSNDMMDTFFTSGIRRAHYDVSTYIDLVVASASSFVKELYRLGARKIGVAGLPPIGCVPSQRTLAGGVQRSCVASQNQAALHYNSKLSHEIQRLSLNHHDATILYMDIYSPLYDIIRHPSAYDNAAQLFTRNAAYAECGLRETRPFAEHGHSFLSKSAIYVDRSYGSVSVSSYVRDAIHLYLALTSLYDLNQASRRFQET